MGERVAGSDMTQVSPGAAGLTLAAAGMVVVLLVGLHVLSPEFDPAWRVISEYANGEYGWVLSLMFAFGAIGAWSLAFAIRSQPKTSGGKVGLGLLVSAGAGAAMAAAFDVNHPLHTPAGLLGVLGLPTAAILTGRSLARTPPWSGVRRPLLWSAGLTLVSLCAFIATMALLIVTYVQAGGDLTTASTEVAELPSGVIALNGWANRLVLVTNSAVWPAVVALIAIRLHGQSARSEGLVAVAGR